MVRLAAGRAHSPLCYSGRRPRGDFFMAAAKPTYDLVILLDTATADELRSKVLADAERLITSNGGTITSSHDWGVRPMAFEIRHKTDAEYHLLQFEGPREVLEALIRTLRITDGVTRFRVIKLRPGTPPAPDVRQDAPAPRAAEDAPAEPATPAASASAEPAPAA
jgi:small subunit ribosomal protein S6